MRERLVLPALAFLVGAAIMAAEIVAPRLVAPHLGTGTLTWCAVLATWLLGLAVGQAIGGRLADRHGTRPIGPLLVAAGAAIALAVPLERGLRDLMGALPHGLRVPLVVLPANLPAALLLGTLAPLLATAALGARASAGRVLGRMAAAGALGSVLGTLGAGCVLIPSVGTRAIHWGLAGAVSAAGVVAWLLFRGEAPPRASAAPSQPDASPGKGDPSLGRHALLAGAALLVFEVVAARVATLHLGASVFTWTSVIGVVLVGLAIGGVIGGRLVDAQPTRDRLALGFVAASAGVATCLWTPALLAPVASLPGPWAWRVLLAVAAAFLVPSILLGTLGPALARCALGDADAEGRTIGRIQALGTAGAVLGAMATPYVLVPALQLPLLVVSTALALALAAGRLRGRPDVPWIVTLLALAVLARAPIESLQSIGRRLGLREDGPGVYVRDSRYFRIRVDDWPERWATLPGGLDADALAAHAPYRGRAAWDAGRNRLVWTGRMETEDFQRLHGWLGDKQDAIRLAALRVRTANPMRQLSIDRLVHGFVDLRDPRWLEYDYERVTAAVVDRVLLRLDGVGGPPEARVLLVGGGTYTFQRRLLAVRDAPLQVTSIEIDPAVTDAAHAVLGLDTDIRHEIVHEDARAWLARREANAPRFDVVLGDAFHDVAVPWHLVTRECAEQVRGALRTDGRGRYVLNIVDDPRTGRFLGSVLCTLESVFEHVAVLSVVDASPESRDTSLLVAGDTPLDLDGLTLPGGGAIRRYAPTDLARWRRAAADRVLTDDHAPVESLLAPVIEARGIADR